MDLFTLNATETTPSVNFNPETGKLIIEGIQFQMMLKNFSILYCHGLKNMLVHKSKNHFSN